MPQPNQEAHAHGEPGESWRIRIGGRTSVQLLADLEAAGIRLNPHARTLLDSPHFTTREDPCTLVIVGVQVRELDFCVGAEYAAILEAARQRNLLPCPLEVGPHFRLQFPDQPEGSVGQPDTRHQAPPGSITVASETCGLDHTLPRGFYLRRIDGVLWLRGFLSDPAHLWNPADRFVFRLADRDPGPAPIPVGPSPPSV